MLPDRQIAIILQKFGPEITQYLQSVGFFDKTGQYEITDFLRMIDGELVLTPDRYAKAYLEASTEKNREVWGVMEKWLFPEMQNFGKDFIDVYGLKPPIDVKQIATDFMEKEGGILVKRMTATDQKRLVKFIWANSQKNERQLARQILKEPHLKEIVGGHRVATIIRTERNHAIGHGANEMANKAGATTKTWHAVGDRRTRASHRKLSGSTWSIDEDIPGEGQYPGQISINCRCYLEYGFNRDVADHPHPSDAALRDLYS